MSNSAEKSRLLVCPPDFFGIEYVINPWMEGNVHRASHELAIQQWRGFAAALEKNAELEIIAPQRALPDMVFTANAGLVLGSDVVLSRFFHGERRGEEQHFQKWFAAHGFNVHELPRDIPFEGAGDALWDHARSILWAAYGMRTELEAHPHLAQMLGAEVVSLRLIDPRFYHLDTCFCPLESGHIIYFPAAFDAHSNRVIEQRVPPELRIAASEDDAENFVCNAVNIDREIFLNRASDELKERLRAAGFRVIEMPLDEFLKAGGATKCLTLRLDEPPLRLPVKPDGERLRGKSSVEHRVLEIEGHLLDSGLLERALELSVNEGGSFRVLSFELGKERQSKSRAVIRIAAPAREILEKITAQLIDLGAVLPREEIADAELQSVTQAGVAPDDFYVTTIYPTEVRANGKWLRMENQRMDGVVVVDAEIGVDPARARCVLIRDLQIAEKIVVGTRGIRTVRDAEAREIRGRRSDGAAAGADEFTFMGAGVSSERRVELVVDQIAWELRRIRERGGKVVVVPGPVVIHTGAGEHLARLIRGGFVQALLGGNAIAVHDIEQALLGTSLGVDLQRGSPVRGGHQHHLRAINLIRRCGSIAAAVEQGILTRGVFYELVKNHILFALAGSIRDDGPLPDTQMDLLKSQAEYARLLKGAEMILMLSTMLHSIGVGNMTPAGVKLVCVDINPAVVTKLADRGSLESTGVVTDVGLFLSLLVQRLCPQPS